MTPIRRLPPRALYREIRAITRLPIKKIINTHFHWDHWQGNQAYLAEFPDVEIITSQRTRERLVDPDGNNGGIGYVDKQLVTLPKEIEKLKADITICGNMAKWRRARLAFFRGYLQDVLAAVTKAAEAGASLEEKKRTLPDLLAVKYEKGMSKYALGQFRDRIALNIEVTFSKAIQKN